MNSFPDIAWRSIVEYLWDSQSGSVRIGSVIEVGTVAVSTLGIVVAAVKRTQIVAWWRLLLTVRATKVFNVVKSRLGLSVERGWPVSEPATVRKPARILVIDNENIPSLPHVDRLRKRGFRVDHRKMLDSKLMERLEDLYDLILLDYRDVKNDLGGENGIDVLRMLRRDHSWIPVIIYSAWTDDFDQEDAGETFNTRVESKQQLYYELEPKIVEMIGESRSESYFRSLLTFLGERNPQEVLDRLRATGKITQVDLSGPSAVPEVLLRRGQANGALRKALQILNGEVYHHSTSEEDIS